MRVTALSREDAERIVTLFASPARDYDPATAAQLLRTTSRGIVDFIQAGRLVPLATGRFAWSDLAHIARTERWTPRIVADALRASAHAALPPALQLASATVRLPVYLIDTYEALRHVRARTRRLPIELSDVVEEALSFYFESVAEDERQEVLCAVPHAAEAIEWPAGGS